MHARFVQSRPEPIAACSGNGEILLMNAPFMVFIETFFGRQPRKGDNIYDYLPPATAGSWRDASRHLFSSLKEFQVF